jgi:hypothetical protein
MPGTASARKARLSLSADDQLELRARAAVPWRALVAAALLSLALGAALLQGLAGQRSSVAPAGRPHGFSQKGLLSLPVAAQGPVSERLGADNPAYQVSTSKGGFAAASPAQRLRLGFGRSGVSVSSGTTHVGLSLDAVGYGGSLRALGQVTPSVKTNRVFYARSGLSEWYVNGPLGLEQGFSIPRPLSAHPAGAPLTLSMALSGNVNASLAAGDQGITLSDAGRPVLRYRGLSATDASGRPLHSWLQLHGERLLLRVDTHNARYPLRIDPFVQQGEKLTGGGESGKGLFGFGVALSSDGNTALIGGYADDATRGAAWVFTRSGSTWTQQGEKLTGSGETGKGYFGLSVALSSDGNTALIGGPEDNATAGAAWVFTRAESTWTQQGEKLTGSGESEKGLFGVSVALSSDGNTALIGAYNDNKGLGAAWVFTRAESTWTQQGEKHTGSGENGKGFFGTSVALSSDGNTALIGGYNDNKGLGAAWVFTRAESTWTQLGKKLTGSGESGKARFAEGVALSGDGNTALIGGLKDNNGIGAAWVFVNWPTITKLKPNNGPETGGTIVTITGTKFSGATAVEFGSVGATSFTVKSDSSIVAVSPAGTATVDVTVSTPSATSSTTLADQFTYLPPPTVTGVSPSSGPRAGGTSVSVTGTNFTGATTVKFGSANAKSFTVNSESSITAVSPAETAGTVDVTVTTPGGASAASAADQFTYLPLPTVTGVSPKEGSVTGGTSVTITGTNFGGATAVAFGSVSGTSFTVNSESSITAVSPAETAGTVNLTVTTPNGTSAISTADRFKFVPTITGLSPNTGSTGGGTIVTVTGTGFAVGTTATVFKFGTTTAGSVNCESSTECNVISPAHAAGKVYVVATVNKVNSPKTAEALFTYL